MDLNAHRNPLLEPPGRPLPRRVGVVGAGTIGPDIAYYLKSTVPELALVLVDIDPGALDGAVERIHGYAKKGLDRGKLTRAQADGVGEGLLPTLDYDDLAGCDLVVEAATENLELKRGIFARVESAVGPDAVITSNTSSLPAGWLFAGLERPARATVTHFFAPAFSNPAVEVVDWPSLDRGTLGWLRWLFAATGKVPMATSDDVCFMLDRVFDNWCNEAALLLDRATAAEIDSVALDYVHAGPFDVLNLAHGNEIIPEVNTLQADEEGEHYRPAPVFRSVATWKTVPRGAPVEVDPEIAAAVRDRLLGIVFSQSVDIVDRSIGDPADLEIGCRLALAFKRGPFALMDDLGEAETVRILDRLGRERPGMPMPGRAVASYQDFRRYVLVDDRDGVQVITLRRPEALNALDDRVTDEILAVIAEREDDPGVSGFVLVGYGPRAFCAGADIGRFPEVLGDADAAAQYARDSARLLVHLDGMAKPVVAAVNGLALGGGLELALRCHGIVAARGTRLQLPEVTLGIAPGIGGMVVPYRRWPEAADRFHPMLLSGAAMSAETAADAGIVDGLADDYAALVALAADRVAALAGDLPRIPDGAVKIPAVGVPATRTARGDPLSPTVVGIIGDAIRDAAAAPTFAEALEIGYRAFGASACTDAAREGIAAFMERRKPDFEKTG